MPASQPASHTSKATGRPLKLPSAGSNKPAKKTLVCASRSQSVAYTAVGVRVESQKMTRGPLPECVDSATLAKYDANSVSDVGQAGPSRASLFRLAASDVSFRLAAVLAFAHAAQGPEDFVVGDAHLKLRVDELADLAMVSPARHAPPCLRLAIAARLARRSAERVRTFNIYRAGRGGRVFTKLLRAAPFSVVAHLVGGQEVQRAHEARHAHHDHQVRHRSAARGKHDHHNASDDRA